MIFKNMYYGLLQFGKNLYLYFVCQPNVAKLYIHLLTNNILQGGTQILTIYF